MVLHCKGNALPAVHNMQSAHAGNSTIFETCSSSACNTNNIITDCWRRSIDAAHLMTCTTPGRLPIYKYSNVHTWLPCPRQPLSNNTNTNEWRKF
jgi:hypothetical protein